MSCVVAECGVIPGNHGTTLNTCPHLDLDLDQSGAWLIQINDKAQGQNISGVNKHEFNAATRQARPCRLVVSAIEHQSVLAAARASTERGHQLDIAPVDQNGLIDIDAPSHLLRPDTALVSIMLANNETGVIQPIGQLAEMIRLRTPSTWIHTDATQAVGKIPINLDDDLRKVDLVCLSAYKFHGPKGIGALFIRDGLTPGPLIHEEQEDGLRGGTLNSAAAAGLAVASDIAANRIANMEHVALLQDGYEDRLIANLIGLHVNGKSLARLPNTVSITIDGTDANELVDALALDGVCIATGSACSAGSDKPSHVLTAMGVHMNGHEAQFGSAYRTRQQVTRSTFCMNC